MSATERCRNDLSASDVRAAFDYDAETGALIRQWNHHHSKPKASGYISIRVGKNTYFAHRLIWLFVHGVWPTHFIDHINGNRSDNRIENLRDVPHHVNMQNQRRGTQASRTGLLGACPHRDKFQAQITVGGKIYHLGLFESAEEAHAAYLNKKRQLHAGCTI